MKTMKWITAMLCMVALVGLTAGAREALPVEADIELLREPMTVEEAKDRFTKVDAAEQGLSRRNRRRAIGVLEELADKGIPVETAYNAVVAASSADADVRELSPAKDADELGKITARMDIENAAQGEGMKAEDVAVAVDVLEGLIEEGVPIEKARAVVKEAISEDRDPQALKDMLTDTEAIEEMKSSAAEKRGKGEDAVPEKMRDRRQYRIEDRIQDRDIEIPSTPRR